eukprot:SAG22_NODE_1947_length_3277_cov_1.880743_2_plen_233_part_00
MLQFSGQPGELEKRLQLLQRTLDGYRRSFEYIQDYVSLHGLKVRNCGACGACAASCACGLPCPANYHWMPATRAISLPSCPRREVSNALPILQSWPFPTNHPLAPQIWQEDFSRIVAFNIEQECNRFLKQQVRGGALLLYALSTLRSSWLTAACCLLPTERRPLVTHVAHICVCRDFCRRCSTRPRPTRTPTSPSRSTRRCVACDLLPLPLQLLLRLQLRPPMEWEWWIVIS